MSIKVYKQRKSLAEYQVIDDNNVVLAGPFFNESSTNSWLFNRGYGTIPCCSPQSFAGSTTEVGYIYYPSTGFYVIDTPEGYNVTLNVNWYSATTPNRFTVYDIDGTFLWSSGWKGNVDYAGPWGSSLSTSTTGTDIIASSNGFKLRVETVNNGSQTDTWNFNTTCNVGTQISS